MIVYTEHYGVGEGEQLALKPREAVMGRDWQDTARQLREQWNLEEERRTAESSQAEGTEAQAGS